MVDEENNPQVSYLLVLKTLFDTADDVKEMRNGWLKAPDAYAGRLLRDFDKYSTAANNASDGVNRRAFTEELEHIVEEMQGLASLVETTYDYIQFPFLERISNDLRERITEYESSRVPVKDQR